MLSDESRDRLTAKVVEYFRNEDTRLKRAALQLRDDGYPVILIIDIMADIYQAGRDEGYEACLNDNR